MEKSDLESYEYQLKQVKQAYALDPTNSELITLKEELETLIKMTKEYLGETATSNETTSKPASTPSAAGTSSSNGNKRKASEMSSYNSAPAASTSSSSSSAKLVSGEECMAKYGGDGKFYPARIVNIAGTADKPIYSVIFKGYDSTELLGPGEVKAMSVDKKRALELSKEEAEKAKKKKKNEKKAETRQVKSAEQNEKKANWQKFAAKSTKKGVSIPGITGSSQFKTSDNPEARVGVVGSGRGVTERKEAKKWEFDYE